MKSISKEAIVVLEGGVAQPSPTGAHQLRLRFDAIDLLRGVIMVIMALDHTREFFTAGTASPRDVHAPALFLTRWITHFCASNFVFLAGVGAFLYVRRGRTLQEGCRFLCTRGLWLLVLELTVIRFGWSFHLWPEIILLQVIWAIGWGLMILSAVIFLPRPMIGVLALLAIAGHNLLDLVEPSSWGLLGWVWSLLHRPAQFQVAPQIRVLELYPLIPWVAVLFAGYWFGPVFLREPKRRRRTLLLAGSVLLALFVALRASGVYGDPSPWTGKETGLAALLSFIDCEKYPPSLLFLCMTVGPALLSLAWFESMKGKVAQVFIIFGRVPLFYYLAHIYLIHLLAIGRALFEHRDPAWLLHGLPPMANPVDWDIRLSGVYGIWLIVVILLFVPCWWFARLKARRPAWWMSYL